MIRIVELTSRMADRLLARLVPGVSASAADCWVETWCDRDARGSALMSRNCCIHASGRVTCTPWYGVCDNCC